MLDAFASPAIPFHFWSVVLFVWGSMVGSFLNVCIHRLPLDQSVVHPRSHCPHCGYSIPWNLNLPIITWLLLRGRCRNCHAPISIRYLIVETVTGLAFLASWLYFGPHNPALAVVYAFVLAGFIAATVIDFEHYIIPDQITLGGIVAGFLIAPLVPALHETGSRGAALGRSLAGIAVGWCLVYGILRLGKLFLGREHLQIPPKTRIVFTEEALCLPDQELPYDHVFYRESDVIEVDAHHLELPDRCYPRALVRLSPRRLSINQQEIPPGEVHHMDMLADRVTLPREAMGFGDVKFMAAIGAFLGWQATLFSLMVSSLLGSAVGITLIALKRREAGGRIPYGPYIAAAAVIWMFGGRDIARQHLGW